MAARDLLLKRTCHLCRIKKDKNTGRRIPAGKYARGAGQTITLSCSVWLCEACQADLRRKIDAK